MQRAGRQHFVNPSRHGEIDSSSDGRYTHAERRREASHFKADCTEADDGHAAPAKCSYGAARFDFLERPSVLRLTPKDKRQQPRKRDSDADDVFGDCARPDAASARDHDRARDQFGTQHPSDTCRRALHPLQTREGCKRRAIDGGGKGNVGIGQKREQRIGVPGVVDGVVRKFTPQDIHEGARQRPGWTGTEDRDENIQSLWYTPERPPALYIKRTSPITMRLSTAFTMS